MVAQMGLRFERKENSRIYNPEEHISIIPLLSSDISFTATQFELFQFIAVIRFSNVYLVQDQN